MSSLQGSNSTTSALSKLTTRLNFLKERRTQIANEIQNMDKGRASSRAAQNPEKSRGFEARQPVQNLDKSQATEVQSVQNTEKLKGSDSCQYLQNMDKPRKPDAPQPQQKSG